MDSPISPNNFDMLQRRSSAFASLSSARNFVSRSNLITVDDGSSVSADDAADVEPRLRLARERISQLENRLSQMRLEQTFDRQQLAELKGELHHSKAEIVQLKEQLLTAEKESSLRTNAQKDEIQRAYSEQQAKSAVENEKRLQEIKKQMEDFKVQLESTRTALRRTEAEKTESNNTVEQLKRKLAGEQQSRSELENQVRMLSSRANDAEREAMGLREKKEHAETLLATAERKLSLAQDELAAKKPSTEDKRELEELRDKLGIATQKNADQQMRIRDLEEQVRNLSMARQSHDCSDAEMLQQLHQAERRAAALERELKELREKSGSSMDEAVRRKLDETMEKNAALDQQLSQQRSSVNRLEMEKRDLMDQLRRADLKVIGAEREKAEAKEELMLVKSQAATAALALHPKLAHSSPTHQHQIQQSQHDHQHQHNHVINTSNSNGTHTSEHILRVAELEAEVTTTRNLLSKLLSSVKPLEKRAEQAEQELAERTIALQEELEKIKKQTFDQTVDNSSRFESDILRQDLEHAQKRIAELTKQCSVLSAENDDMKRLSKREEEEGTTTKMNSMETVALRNNLTEATQELKAAKDRIFKLERRLGDLESSTPRQWTSSRRTLFRDEEYHQHLHYMYQEKDKHPDQGWERFREEAMLRETDKRRAQEQIAELERRIGELEDQLVAATKPESEPSRQYLMEIQGLELELQQSKRVVSEAYQMERQYRNVLLLNDELTEEISRLRAQLQVVQTQQQQQQTQQPVSSSSSSQHHDSLPSSFRSSPNGSRSEREVALVRMVEELDAALRRAEAKPRQEDYEARAALESIQKYGHSIFLSSLLHVLFDVVAQGKGKKAENGYICAEVSLLRTGLRDRWYRYVTSSPVAMEQEGNRALVTTAISENLVLSAPDILLTSHSQRSISPNNTNNRPSSQRSR